MIIELRVLSSAVIASLLIAFPTMAKDTGLPGIDLQKSCRSRAKAGKLYGMDFVPGVGHRHEEPGA